MHNVQKTRTHTPTHKHTWRDVCSHNMLAAIWEILLMPSLSLSLFVKQVERRGMRRTT